MFDFSKRARAWAMAWLFISLMLLTLAGCGGDVNDGGSTSPPASTKATVGAEGGTVNGPDGVQVVIPAGALDKPTEIGIARSAAGAPAELPEDYTATAATPIYEFTPHDLVFNTPVTIRVPTSVGTPNAEILMASPGADWQVTGARVSGGFAEWQRNSFSFGFVPACAPANRPPYSSANPDPYPCSIPSGGAEASATPPTGITKRSSGNIDMWSGSAGSWAVTAASTVRLTLNYRAAPDCQNPRAKLVRTNLAVPSGTPGRVRTLFDGPVALTPTNLSNPYAFGGGSYVRGVGSTSHEVSFSHLDNGTSAFFYSFSCNRPSRVTHSGGDFLTFVATIPVPTTTYAIGGSVSGLTGAGLLLQNNGGDNLSVPANGVFRFATAIGAGTPYAVTVLTQPVGQTCTVQNGSGTANANVSNVAVSCAVASAKAWQGAALLETLDVGEALEPQVAFDGSGNAIAVWYQQSPGGFFGIYARPYVSATGWGAIEKILTADSALNYLSPQVALDANGNAIIVFTALVSEIPPPLFTARYTALNASWAPATQLADNGVNPRIAVDTAGNALAVWEKRVGISRDILASRYEASTSTWDAARVISADLGGLAPQIAFDGSGNAIAIWEMLDTANANGGYKIMSDRYVAGSGWNVQGLPTTIATGSAGNGPRLAVDAAGNAMAVWVQRDATTDSIFSSRYAGGSWGAPALVETSANWAAQPSVAMAANGNAVVVWQHVGLSDDTSIWARRYVAGVGGTAVRIDDLSGYTSGGFPQIAMDAAGNAMAVWIQGSYVWANRYAQGAGWAGATLTDSTAAGGSSAWPDVAVDANGNAIAVWSHTSAPAHNIWANVFR